MRLDSASRFADPAIVSNYTLDAATREIIDYRVSQRAANVDMWWVAVTG